MIWGSLLGSYDSVWPSWWRRSHRLVCLLPGTRHRTHPHGSCSDARSFRCCRSLRSTRRFSGFSANWVSPPRSLCFLPLPRWPLKENSPHYCSFLGLFSLFNSINLLNSFNLFALLMSHLLFSCFLFHSLFRLIIVDPLQFPSQYQAIFIITFIPILSCIIIY